MKPFVFKPEKILELRAFREGEAKIELGRAVGALTMIEGQIKNTAQDRARAAADRFSGSNGISEILSYEHYIRRLDAKREDLLKEAAQAELKVEEARRAYVEASRDRKILDKLKEKRLREYRRARQAEETKTLDDISGGMAARKKAGINVDG
jgi:flagellar FliJ protein